jgi:hypothetical protein
LGDTEETGTNDRRGNSEFQKRFSKLVDILFYRSKEQNHEQKIKLTLKRSQQESIP